MTTDTNGSGAAGAGQPGAAGAGTGGAAPAAPAGGADGGGQPWYAALPESVRGVAEAKGWQKPEAVIESYQNLEKLLGADKAGRGVVLPKDDNDVEGIKAFRAKIGVPETPDGYKIPVPEKGGDPEFAKMASGWFHKHGIPAKAAAGLAQEWNAHIAGLVAASEKADEQKAEAEISALRQEWGATFDQNLEIAKRGGREFGVTEEQFDAIEKAMGPKATIELFQRIGSKLGEAPVDGLGGGDRSTGRISTPAGAEARLKELRSDGEWMAKYVNGDVEAVREFNHLTDLIARGQMAAQAKVAAGA